MHTCRQTARRRKRDGIEAPSCATPVSRAVSIQERKRIRAAGCVDPGRYVASGGSRAAMPARDLAKVKWLSKAASEPAGRGSLGAASLEIHGPRHGPHALHDGCRRAPASQQLHATQVWRSAPACAARVPCRSRRRLGKTTSSSRSIFSDATDAPIPRAHTTRRRP